MHNRFLAKYQSGKHDQGSLIGSFGLTWGFFFLFSGIPILLIVSWYILNGELTFREFLDDPSNLSGMGIPALAVFIGVMGQFPISFIGLWLSNKFVLKRSMKTFITAATHFRWKRFLTGMLLWMALMAGYGLLFWTKAPDSLQYAPDWDSFFNFLPFIVVLVPIQCAFEEIAIRGQLMQNMTGYLQGKTVPLVPLLVSSVFFAVLHGLNPEVSTYGFGVMMAQYFSMGLIFGLFALLDEGLEIAIGLHIGNNLFSLLLVSYPGSVLPTPSLFLQTSVEPWQDLLALIGMATVLFLVLYGKNPGRIKRLILKEI